MPLYIAVPTKPPLMPASWDFHYLPYGLHFCYVWIHCDSRTHCCVGAIIFHNYLPRDAFRTCALPCLLFSLLDVTFLQLQYPVTPAHSTTTVPGTDLL